MAKQMLKDAALRSVKPEAKDKRLNDGEGLYLLVKTNGAKWWRFDYSFEGKRKTLSVGVFLLSVWPMPEQERRRLGPRVASGNDPSESRKEVKAAKQLAKLNEERQSEGLGASPSSQHRPVKVSF